MRRALGRLADEPTYLQHALGPGVAARERRSVRHGPAVDRFVEVLGREIEGAGAKLLNHPLDLVHPPPRARPPPPGPPPARVGGPRSPLPRAPHRHRAAGESAARSCPTAPPPPRSSTSSLDATQSHR